MRSNGGRWNGSDDQVWRRGLASDVLAVAVADAILLAPVLALGLIIDGITPLRLEPANTAV